MGEKNCLDKNLMKVVVASMKMKFFLELAKLLKLKTNNKVMALLRVMAPLHKINKVMVLLLVLADRKWVDQDILHKWEVRKWEELHNLMANLALVLLDLEDLA